MRMSIAMIGVASMLVAAPLAGADDARAPAAPQATTENPIWTPDAATIAQVRDIVAKTQGADGVFVVQDDGKIRHVQSGLICRAKYPNVSFWHAFVYPSNAGQGTDVGCDYGRNDSDGKAVSKLSIFATRAAEGMTLDQAFARYRNEVVQVTPNAISHGEAIVAEDKNPAKPSTFPEFRSEEFGLVLDGRPYTSQLLVLILDGWVIEIRSTFEGEANNIVVTKEGGVAAAVLAGGDRMMLPHALLDAIETVGKQP